MLRTQAQLKLHEKLNVRLLEKLIPQALGTLKFKLNLRLCEKLTARTLLSCAACQMEVANPNTTLVERDPPRKLCYLSGGGENVKSPNEALKHSTPDL